MIRTRALRWTLVIALVLMAVYGALWAYSYHWMTREIDRAYEEAEENGYRYLGPKPVLTGFPFVPEIYYGGGFQSGNIMVEFAESRLRGYPIPGLTFNLSLPRGVSVGGPVDPSIWSLNTLKADIVIPSTIPADFTSATLSAWQRSGGQFDIRHYELTKDGLISEGKGLFTLDAELQPELAFESRIKGYDLFIQSLLQQRLIEPFPAAIAIGVLNNLSKPDEETGENTVTVNINVQNRMLTVGPIQVMEIPKIVWAGSHSSPDLLQ